MRSFVIILLVAAFCALVVSYPADAINEQNALNAEEEIHEEQHIRQKRATCDIGSAFNINHAACAVHCVTKGFRGGWCDNRQVCNCRH